MALVPERVMVTPEAVTGVTVVVVGEVVAAVVVPAAAEVVVETVEAFLLLPQPLKDPARRAPVSKIAVKVFACFMGFFLLVLDLPQ